VSPPSLTTTRSQVRALSRPPYIVRTPLPDAGGPSVGSRNTGMISARSRTWISWTRVYSSLLRAAVGPLATATRTCSSQVGELSARGRLDVDSVQGSAKLVLADAQLRDHAAKLMDTLAAGVLG
jgi:hypothetical protein